MIGIAIIFSVGSCSEDDNNAISGEEAAEIVAMTISEDAFGATGIIYATVEAADDTDNSGMQKVQNTEVISKDTTINYSSNPNALVTCELSAGFSYEVSLDELGVPVSAVAGYTYEGNFDAPRLSSEHTGSGSLTLTGLENDECMVNGTYSRTSGIEKKGLNARSLDAETRLTFNDVKVNKANRKIKEGTASLSIEGTSNKGSFKYTGTITFNSNDEAILIIQNRSYAINTATGDYTVL